MLELLELILKNITTHPDDVKILTSQDKDTTIFTITTHPDDMGRVIGKSGKVIRSIRSIAHVVGIRQGVRYRINVAEEAGMDSMPDSTDTLEDQEEMTADMTPIEDDVIVGAIDISEEEK